MAFYRERVFPWLLENVVRSDELETIRDRVVEKAAGHVIEIGSGAGANFLSYSSTITSLTTVEPNPGMNRRARRRIKYLEFPVDTRETSCDELPMKEGSFDCAVTTFSICSFRNARGCLREIYRVLKPGGRFLFLEHGLSDTPGVRAWQQRLTPLQRKLCDGCSLDRRIDVIIREAGFEIDELSTYDLRRVPRILGHVYEGTAYR